MQFSVILCWLHYPHTKNEFAAAFECDMRLIARCASTAGGNTQPVCPNASTRLDFVCFKSHGWLLFLTPACKISPPNNQFVLAISFLANWHKCDGTAANSGFAWVSCRPWEQEREKRHWHANDCLELYWAGTFKLICCWEWLMEVWLLQ